MESDSHESKVVSGNYRKNRENFENTVENGLNRVLTVCNGFFEGNLNFFLFSGQATRVRQMAAGTRVQPESAGQSAGAIFLLCRRLRAAQAANCGQ